MIRAALLGVGVFMVLISPAQASRLGNPTAMLEEGQVAVGTEYTFYQKDVEVGSSRGEIKSHRILGRVSYGVHEQIEVFGKFGASNMETKRLFDGGFRIAGGGGIKFTILEHEPGHVDEPTKWKLGVMGQVMRYKYEDSIGVSGTSFSDTVDIIEYDVAVGMSYAFEKFTPYAGSYLNFIEGRESTQAGLLGTGTTGADFNEEDIVGVFVGADFELTDGLKLSAEGRFVDQTTVSAEFSYAF